MITAPHWRVVNLVPKGLGPFALSAVHPTTPSSSDPYWPEVLSRLTFDDAADIGYDVTGLQWTTGSVSFDAASKFGPGCVSFSGSAGSDLRRQMSLPADFTIEGWVHPKLSGTRVIFGYVFPDGRRFSFYRQGASNALSLYQNIGSPESVNFASVPANTWSHVALVRKSGITRLYLNGTLLGQATFLTQSISGGTAYLGQSGAGSEYWGGLMDDFRITGVARYDGASFNVPQAALPLGNDSVVEPIDLSSASFTSTIDPIEGDLQSLKDGLSSAVFPQASGLALRWSFPSAVSVGDVHFMVPDQTNPLIHADLEFSQDGISWEPYFQPSLLWRMAWGIDGGGYLGRRTSTLLLKPAVHTAVNSFGDRGALAAKELRRLSVADMEHGGPGTIHGTVEQKLAGDATLPLKRRVRLHRSRDGMLVRETWSDESGNYRFDGLNPRYEYDVIAWDHEGQFRSTIANNLKPEVLP